jgi:hypothetical protein
MVYIEAEAFPNVISNGFQTTSGRVYAHNGDYKPIPVDDLTIVLKCHEVTQYTERNVAEVRALESVWIGNAEPTPSIVTGSSSLINGDICRDYPPGSTGECAVGYFMRVQSFLTRDYSSSVPVIVASLAAGFLLGTLIRRR